MKLNILFKISLSYDRLVLKNHKNKIDKLAAPKDLLPRRRLGRRRWCRGVGRCACISVRERFCCHGDRRPVVIWQQRGGNVPALYSPPGARERQMYGCCSTPPSCSLIFIINFTLVIFFPRDCLIRLSIRFERLDHYYFSGKTV